MKDLKIYIYRDSDNKDLTKILSWFLKILPETTLGTHDVQFAWEMTLMSKADLSSFSEISQVETKYFLIILGLLERVNSGSICLNLDTDLDFFEFLFSKVEVEFPFAFDVKELVKDFERLMQNQLELIENKNKLRENNENAEKNKLESAEIGIKVDRQQFLFPSKPMIYEDFCLYLEKHYLLREKMKKKIYHRLQKEVVRDWSGNLNDLFLQSEDAQNSLNDDQKLAVHRALEQPFSIITGGAGTGKTTVIKSIVNIYNKMNETNSFVPKIALAAPTGKAANRMEQIIRAQSGQEIPPEQRPRTIHRLLVYMQKANAFYHHRNNPLDYDLLIIDESSMVDTQLLDSVLEAAKKIKHIVLVGDANQLPPVKSDSIFFELVQNFKNNKSSALVTVLKKSYRQRLEDKGKGRNIYQVAEKMKKWDGTQNLYSDAPLAKEDTLDFDEFIKVRNELKMIKYEGVEQIVEQKLIPTILFQWWELFVKPLFDFILTEKIILSENGEIIISEKLEKVYHKLVENCVLCITNGGKTGRKYINSIFHHFYLEHLKNLQNNNELQVEKFNLNQKFLHGEPVIVKNNDYYRNIFNGDVGITIEVEIQEKKTDDKFEQEKKQMVVFQYHNGFKVFPFDKIRENLDLAWAVTVHKSQGSEFKNTVLILPPKETSLSSRQLLYTALTRAKQSALIIGKKQIIKKSLQNNQLKSSINLN